MWKFVWKAPIDRICSPTEGLSAALLEKFVKDSECSGMIFLSSIPRALHVPGF